MPLPQMSSDIAGNDAGNEASPVFLLHACLRTLKRKLFWLWLRLRLR
eukprot:COSAG06_NODE_46357_length_347_cov_1.221774_2_plen_46_part_01